MPFVNEYISKEDFEKYGLEKIDQRFIVGGVYARDWTIDRERDIYLRQVARGREEFMHISKWTFFWHGELLWLEVHSLSCVGERGGSGHAVKRVERLSSMGSPVLAPHLQSQREQIIADLTEAMIASKGGGVFSTFSDYTLDLEVA